VHTRLERLTQEASTDPLTGAGNRRWLDYAAERRLAAALLVERPVAVIMMDLDHFKALNDAFGHSAGDAVLRGVAEAVLHDLRPLDVFARIGGEEFCLLLFDAGLEAAHHVAERLRGLIAAMRWPDWPDMQVTASLGVAEVSPGEVMLEPAMTRADAALYTAKEAGRDRVMLQRGR
jgi:diguanylate cyclase (GGDEF)-like protein